MQEIRLNSNPKFADNIFNDIDTFLYPVPVIFKCKFENVKNSFL